MCLCARARYDALKDLDPCMFDYYEGDLFKCQQVPYFCDDTPRYLQNWRMPMEFCRRNPFSEFCTTRSYRDSLNNFEAGKTAVDYELLSGGLTTQEVFQLYSGWVESYALFGYRCDATISDPSSPNYGVNARTAASRLMNNSGFEVSLKPFLAPPLGLIDEPQFVMNVTGCCQCEPHSMPSFFNKDILDAGFPDNKHSEVQLSISALKDTSITVCLELQHAQYLAEFETHVHRTTTYKNGTSEIFVHVPYRANYTPKSRKQHYSFLALIKKDQTDGNVMLPLNLPRKFVRDPQALQSSDYSTGHSKQFEYDITIDRPSRVTSADPCNLLLEQGGGMVTGPARAAVCNFEYRASKRANYLADINTEQAAELRDDGQGSNVPYMVSDDYDLVKPSLAWWRNPPNTGEDMGAKAAFETYPSTWGRGEVPKNRFSGVGDSTDSTFMRANENDFLYMPWLPYFSNCDGYDSHMHFMKLIETHPDCLATNEDYKDTQYVVQMPGQEDFTFASPKSDKCVNPLVDTPPAIDTVSKYIAGIQMRCTYEENVEAPGNVPRWFELAAGKIPFYLTKYPVQPDNFVTDWTQKKTPTSDPRWGRSYFLWQQKDGEKVLPVLIDDIFFSDIGVLPRHVKLYVEYFQEDPGTKRLVKASIQFFDLCYTRAADQAQIAVLEKKGVFLDQYGGVRPCNYTWDGKLNDTEYMLEFTMKPAEWVDLLNYFELRGEVYMAFYTVIGVLSVLEAIVIWVLNRLLTRLRHPPPFHAQSMLKIISEGPMIGVSLAVFPMGFVCLLVAIWFKSYANYGGFASANPAEHPATANLEAVDGNYMDSMALSATQIFEYAYGRTGVCFLAIGFYVNFFCSSLIVPNWKADEDEEIEAKGGAKKPKDEFGADIEDEDEPPPSSTWAPVLWKRSHLIISNFFLWFVMLWVWEFSYGQWFEDNVYTFIIIFKVVQIVMDIIFKEMMKEHLMSNPLIILVGMTEILVTMGSADFTQFVMTFFVELSIVGIERLYLDPLVKHSYKLLPRWKMQFNRRFGDRRKMTREDKAKEEMQWRRVNEAIELQAEGIEPLMDSYSVFSCETVALLCTPVMNLFFMVFRNETMIPFLYGIRETDLVFYAFFNFYIVVFSFVEDVFILNAQELVHGWKVFDYVSYQRYRFSVREHRWGMDARVVDESIAQGMQMLDCLCFSEQYFFLLAVYGLGNMIAVCGLTIFLRHNYNMFGDPVFLLILVVMFVLGDLMQWLCVYLGNIRVRRLGWRGLWMTKHIEGTVDDDVAAKLAIGEGRQADLEQERLELQALNSERFRHRFLDRNRPWVLQHLVELLTPESLNDIGPDGRPVVEYIRDVYAELLAMGEGARKKGDRSDISSDEEEDRGPAAGWPRTPLHGTSLAIAKMWLAKARKRRAFHKLIAGVILGAEEEACAVCGRSKAVGAKMTVQLATNGFADDGALDRLILGFEQQYSEKETDANLWRAYFRAHAEFITRCERCVNELEQGKLHRDVKAPGGQQRTRAADLSSDEEEEDVMFDPVVVVRESNEGKMLSKWLDAARRRCGGTFPRPEARKQMEEYAEKMRQRKLKKARDKKRAAGGGDDEGSGDDEAGASAAAAAKWKVAVSAASRALAQRWLRKAQDSMLANFKAKGASLRAEVEKTMRMMAPEDDWYFGAELRAEGQAVADMGDQLAQDMRTVEAEEAVKVRRVENDFETFEKEKRAIIDGGRTEFEAETAAEVDRANDMIAIRTRELQRNAAETRKEFDAEEKKAREEEGAVPPAMLEEHRVRLEELDGIVRVTQQRMERERNESEKRSRALYDAKEKEWEEEVVGKRVHASSQIRSIRKAALVKMKGGEVKWQADAAKWLFASQRKIEAKSREDAEDAAKKTKKKRK